MPTTVSTIVCTYGIRDPAEEAGTRPGLQPPMEMDSRLGGVYGWARWARWTDPTEDPTEPAGACSLGYRPLGLEQASLNDIGMGCVGQQAGILPRATLRLRMTQAPAPF